MLQNIHKWQKKRQENNLSEKKKGFFSPRKKVDKNCLSCLEIMFLLGEGRSCHGQTTGQTDNKAAWDHASRPKSFFRASETNLKRARFLQDYNGMVWANISKPGKCSSEFFNAFCRIHDPWTSLHTCWNRISELQTKHHKTSLSTDLHSGLQMNIRLFLFQESGKTVLTERVVVFERRTGKVLTGPMAPTPASLKTWLTRHPTFEVLVSSNQTGPTHSSGTMYSSMFCSRFLFGTARSKVRFKCKQNLKCLTTSFTPLLSVQFERLRPKMTSVHTFWILTFVQSPPKLWPAIVFCATSTSNTASHFGMILLMQNKRKRKWPSRKDNWRRKDWKIKKDEQRNRNEESKKNWRKRRKSDSWKSNKKKLFKKKNKDKRKEKNKGRR